MKTKQQLSKAISAAMLAAALFFGSSAVFAQVKIGTNPTTIGTSSNLEIEATNNKKILTDKTTGTLKVENKPLAATADSIVTRGTDGELHQISAQRLLDQQKIPVTIFQGTLIGSQTAPIIVSQNSLDQRINLTPRPGYSAVWDATNKQITLPADGYYHFEAGISCIGSGPGATSVLVTRIWIGAAVSPFDFNYAPISTNFGASGSQLWSGNYVAGTKVSMNVYINPINGSPGYPASCSAGYFNVTKVN